MTFAEYLSKVHCPMPTTLQEDYSQSQFVNDLYNFVFDPAACVTQPVLPISSDYLLGPHSTADFPTIPFAQLDATYARAHNSLKQAFLAHEERVICLEPKEPCCRLAFFATTGTLNHTKVHILVGRGQHIHINIDTYCEDESLLAPLIFLSLEEESQVDVFYQPKKNNNMGLLHPWIEVVAHGQSQLRFHSFSHHIPRQRIGFLGYLMGKESSISIHSAFCLAQNQAADFYTRIIHENAESTSHQAVNAVTLDAARMNFNGLIAATPKAQQISAYQMFKGLLLGAQARITARPQLDIEYDNLACSHGVSIGGFTDEELFYLQSRGLSQHDLIRLLTYGFLSEPFVHLDQEGPWRSTLKKTLKV